MKKIVLANAKGGVAKTSFSTNLAYILASIGKRVLFVDLDPQENATDFFVAEDESEIDFLLEEDENIYFDVTLSDMLQDYNKTKVYKTRIDNIDLLPGDLEMLETEKTIMIGMTAQHNRLENILKKIESDNSVGYDYCIIDCPPNLGMLVLNAYIVADNIIIPAEANRKSIKGIKMTVNNLISVIDSYGLPKKDFKVLFTMANRNNTNKNVMNKIKEKYPTYKNFIRYQGKPFDKSEDDYSFIVEDNTPVADDYLRVAREFLEYQGELQ